MVPPHSARAAPQIRDVLVVEFGEFGMADRIAKRGATVRFRPSKRELVSERDDVGESDFWSRHSGCKVASAD